MASSKEILDELTDYWIGWDQRGSNPIDYDVEDGPRRRKCREFEERQKAVKQRTSAFEEARAKYGSKE
ncbi:hypothetical protein VPHD479_0082 [Vibrio phage D479]